MPTYNLSTSLSARTNLDDKATRDAYDDASDHYPDVVEGEDLRIYANSLVDQAFEQSEDLTAIRKRA